jgi:hypothetical protein
LGAAELDIGSGQHADGDGDIDQRPDDQQSHNGEHRNLSAADPTPLKCVITRNSEPPDVVSCYRSFSQNGYYLWRDHNRETKSAQARFRRSGLNVMRGAALRAQPGKQLEFWSSGVMEKVAEKRKAANRESCSSSGTSFRF